MSAELVFSVASINGIAERVQSLSDYDREQLLDALGAEIESQIRRRITDEKTSPDGVPWPALTEDYAKRKAQKSGGGLLEYSGAFLDSIQYQVVDDTVESGSNLVQAAHLNFGGEEIGTNMPAREYLGFSPENFDDLLFVTEDFLQNVLNEL